MPLTKKFWEPYIVYLILNINSLEIHTYRFYNVEICICIFCVYFFTDNPNILGVKPGQLKSNLTSFLNKSSS